MSAGVAGAVIALVLAGAAFAQPASASRPFDYAALHKSPDTGRIRLVVKTVTGIEKPDRLRLRASGQTAHAKEIKGSVGRWAVNEETAEGRALIVAVMEGFDLFRFAKLHAVGHYREPCGSEFGVLFKIEDFNQRDDDAQFRKATGCD